IGALLAEGRGQRAEGGGPRRLREERSERLRERLPIGFVRARASTRAADFHYLVRKAHEVNENHAAARTRRQPRPSILETLRPEYSPPLAQPAASRGRAAAASSR